MINLKTINERFNKIEKRLVKLESKQEAKNSLIEILKSGYTTNDLQRLVSEIEGHAKDSIFTEIISALNDYENAYNYYSNKSGYNLFKNPELDNDLLDATNDLLSN